MSELTDHPITILLVDDDRLILATLAKGIRQVGYRVIEASSGEEALELLHDVQPDIALVDVRMPGMSGIEFAQHLRDEKGGIPFIFLSAYSDLDVVKQAADNGALGYLVKPLDIPQIIPALEAALSRADEIRQLQRREAQLSAALNTGRETSMAVGVLMERLRLGREAAFEALRERARSRQRKISDVAGAVLAAVETLNVKARRERDMNGNDPPTQS